MTARIHVLLVTVLVAAASVGFTTLDRDATASPGDEEMTNLELVANFPYGEQLEDDRQATDVDFVTAELPLRDADGVYVDETGQPLPDGAAPVIAERDLLVVGDRDTGAHLYDITDPENAFETALIECPHPRSDPAITKIETDEGTRLLVAISREGGALPCTGPVPVVPDSERGAGGAAVFDVTDPYDPQPEYSLETAGGAHNLTFHPTEPYLYISTGDLPGGMNHIPVWDLSDLDAPELVADPEIEGGPHDIEFSPDGTRAYVASENNHQIWDTTDPAAPARISRTPNVGTYAHGLFASPDGRYMLANNESLALGGFFVGGTAVCPGEGLMIYDIAGDNEANPIPMGYFEADVQGLGPDDRACTSHFGNVGASGTAMTIGWYIAGTRVIDFSDPTQPTEVGAAVLPGSEVWSARTYEGPYIYVGDVRRGLDILKWSGDGPAPWEAAATE